MFDRFQEQPGLLYVVATFLPLASFALILLAAMARSALRGQREAGGAGQTLFELLGGDNPRWPAYVATGAIGLAFVCSVAGFYFFHETENELHVNQENLEKRESAYEKVEKEIKKAGIPVSHAEKIDYLGGIVNGLKILNALDKDRSFTAWCLRPFVEKAFSPYQARSAELSKLHHKFKKAEEELEAARKENQELQGRFKASITWAALTTRAEKIKDVKKDAAEVNLADQSARDALVQLVKWLRPPPVKEVSRYSLGLQPNSTPLPDPERGTQLRLGFNIDSLSVIMFLMVTLVATLIHIFSIGYMGEERDEMVTDHQVASAHGHLHRRGRYGRFFLFMSLFCFSMLNLVLADNLFQVFLSWELVGICSYLLIGFYHERTSASNAANKAFITNRIGDAGFIVGMLILWTYVGTFNMEGLFGRLRAPDKDAHSSLPFAGHIVRAEISDTDPESLKPENQQKGNFYLRVCALQEPVRAETRAILFPRDSSGHHHWKDEEIYVYGDPPPDQCGSMPYWLLVVAGLGIFLGCVGKSAQFPLHVWLPDAMEGPTPVSALIHAATMVAAGVYLVGRVFPLFTPEVQLVIAYTGAITLFLAATIALVQTDIKKVLAYSTVSQLGYMMLALGVGGWVAGQFHLITHAFFKALLFLCSGAVIYNCHHEQDMTRMGGLYPKMKITALTMLVGVLAIAGTPLFSGWYSKDAILADAWGFVTIESQRPHFLLFLLPLLTAGITTFYMFRMWYLTFTGKPRDEHIYEQAHEAPRTMTVPLIILAVGSVVVAWGWPVWNPEASWLEHQLHHSQPRAIAAEFGLNQTELEANEPLPGQVRNPGQRRAAQENHLLAGNLALLIVILAFVFATLVYYYRVLDPAEAQEQFPGVHRFLASKWYFDELYSALLVRPALAVARWFRAFDAHVIDGFVDGSGRFMVGLSWRSGKVDNGIVDGLVNLIARVGYAIGAWLRTIQTGYLRSYVLFLVLAAVALWIVLTALFGTAAGGGGK